MIDPTVSLAMSMKANPGAYAVLFGSGVSYSSGIPTGWGIIVDLIKRVASMYGEQVGEDPAGWYRGKFAKEPDYSELIEAVARTPTERSRLLRGYFEPTDQERDAGLKAPTPGHRALARLAKAGIVRVFITTNFDRLLERALEDLNVVPTVIAVAADIDGTPPLSAQGVTVLKVHGDYVDCRILNTPTELAQYDPAINALLDRIIAQHGFVLAGWSALWDHALVEAFLRAPVSPYSTWWAGRRPPKGPGARLMAARSGEFVQLVGSDPFFTRLAERVLEGRQDAPAQHNLPPQLSSFVGRVEDLEHIDALLDSNRVVTLTALGGSGKTRTALEVARSRLPKQADGCWFVDLTATVEPAQVPQAIARGLGYSTEKLQDALRLRQVLIVLDNCEHVLDAVAEYLPTLLAGPHVRVLATSRIPLGTPGEVVETLPPLSVPPKSTTGASEIAQFDAVHLFVQRVHEVNNRWQLGQENAVHVARICRYLDGHPLALELAAARIKVLPPRVVADRLQSGIQLLKAGSRDRRPDRQRTLAAAWQWSHDALDPDARELFEQLAVFPGHFSFQSAEAVAADIEDVLESLSELIDQGLVVFAGDGSYRMLAPVRQFALAKLRQRGGSDAAHTRHAAYFIGRINRFAMLADPDQADRESVPLMLCLDDLRVASTSAERLEDLGTRMLFHTAFASMLGFAGLQQEGVTQLEHVLSSAEAPPLLRAAALYARADLVVGDRDRAAAARAVAEATAAWEAIGDPTKRAECRWLAAVDALICGDLMACERLAREGLSIGAGGASAAMLHIWLSWSLRRQDRADEAGAAAVQAGQAAQGQGVTPLLWSMSAAGFMAEQQGDWTTAAQVFDAQWAILQQFPDFPMVGPAAITLSVAMSKAIRGDLETALALARRSNETFATRDDSSLRMYISMMHRGRPSPEDLEASLERLRKRLRLPMMEAAADSIVERLDELTGRLDAQGLTQKAHECRHTRAKLLAAVG